MLTVSPLIDKAGSTLTVSAIDDAGTDFTGWSMSATVRHALTRQPLLVLSDVLAGPDPVLTVTDEQTLALGPVDARYDVRLEASDGVAFLTSNTARFLLLPAVTLPGDEAAGLPPTSGTLLDASMVGYDDQTVEEALDGLDERLDAVEAQPPAASWDDLTGKPETFPPSEHTHPLPDHDHDERYAPLVHDHPLPAHGHAASVVTYDPAASQLISTNTQAAIDEVKALIDVLELGGDDAVDWTEVLNKPGTFPAAPHSHPTADVTGLDAALAGKADQDHAHAIGDVTGLQTALDELAPLPPAPADWTSIINKPLFFTPEQHEHPEYALDGHTHPPEPHRHDYLDLDNVPLTFEPEPHTLDDVTDAGTAAALDAPGSGDALATEVVLGSDSRLTDARPALPHLHTKSEITDFGDYAPAAHDHDGDYAPLVHAHPELAPAAHLHTKADLTDFSDADYADAAHDHSALEIPYDPVLSGLAATDVQDALDELAARPTGGGAAVSWLDLLDKPLVFAPEAHGHDAATTATDGFMSAADKVRLDAVGTMAARNLTVSASAPSGGVHGDVWFVI